MAERRLRIAGGRGAAVAGADFAGLGSFLALVDGHDLFPADATPIVVTRAPGRLDVMGGIADYSGARVLEATIPQATYAALQRRADDQVVVESTGPGRAAQRVAIALQAVVGTSAIADSRSVGEALADRGDAWAAYAVGAFTVLARERGVVFDGGATIVVHSDVPQGRGLSSSASLEVAVMEAVVAAYEIDLDPIARALLCQQVENDVVGAPCGVMDQLTVELGDRDVLTVLLCQPAKVEAPLPVPAEIEFWGIDSGAAHSVSAAPYGRVRTAAFMGKRILAANGLDVPYLASITPPELAELDHVLPELLSGGEFLERFGAIADPVSRVEPAELYPVRAATRHPVYEHERVTRFAALLRSGDSSEATLVDLGQLMLESHESYGACGLGAPETDELVELVMAAGSNAGLFGAKITGGGSGGTVAIVARRGAEEAVLAVRDRFARERGLPPPHVVRGSSPGADRFGYLELRRRCAAGPCRTELL